MRLLTFLLAASCWISSLAAAPAETSAPVLASSPAKAEVRVLKNDEVLPLLDARQKRFLKGLPKFMDYGWIEVPEDWAEATSPRVRVFWHRLKARRPSGKEPVIYYNGGPGAFTEEGYMDLMRRTPDRDFVMLHQRGTGCGSLFPDGADAASVKRLRLYLSRAIVLDSEALRRSLYGEDSRWCIVGQSYGAMIGHRYLEICPGSISSLHLHGHAPMDKPQLDAELRLRAHHANLTRFLAAHPECRSRLEVLRRHLDDPKNGFSFGSLRLEGRHSLGYAGLIFLSEDSEWPQLAGILQYISPDGKTVHREALEAVVKAVCIDELEIDNPSNPLNTVCNRIECYGSGKQSLSDFYTEIFDRMAKEGSDPREWLLGEEALAHFTMNSPALKLADTIDFGPLDLIDPAQEAANLKASPEIEFYLYSSDQDPLSPPAIFDPLVKLCGPRIHYQIIRGTGHGGFMNERPFWSDLRKLPAPAKIELKKAG
ncbi:MAG: hypothetical protein RL095_1071 [Verrucomicrobiota bacterium]|jgi:pimeloyl-ACP methyl ester carboxylesterase